MDAEIKKEWVKALLSGDYDQGHSVLHNADAGTYCCLGVLCEVQKVPKTKVEDRYFSIYEFDGDEPGGRTGGVPDGFAGLTRHQQHALIDMNDSSGCTFNQIADYIEREL